ncbi:hypothetical protein GUJ93_ZPchr0011g27001 [Zizania palustris]|uniref:Uncharacterized protein n=1 Tax=Zizania palustris TaxID=103762 RepID=A0A8J6BLX6_ZIZPA|nr:hypothetical protein GUJ93_ZPchr0011g27001 [Zizania palustris]
MKERVRRRRIPAFGEWNYDHDGGCGYGYGGGDWPVTQYFDSAMQAGLVIALPPASPKPPKKAVKWIDSGALAEDAEEGDEKQQKVVVGLAVAAAEQHGARKPARRLADDAGAHAAYHYKACRPVKAVDQDLYEIPPDMLCHNPRKRVTTTTTTRRRSSGLWVSCCLGLSCVAA